MHLDDVLTELVERSGDRLLRVAYQLTHDRAAAQDLVQEALLRVYGSVRRRGRTPEDWYAYLRRAVINEYVRTRRLRSSTEVVTDMVPERPVAGCPEDRAADQARRVPGQQVGCTLVGGPQTNYLIGLIYPGGARIWVAATDEPNECVSASNGEFTSFGVVGPEVSRAFASGRWPVPQAVSCARPRQDIGRLGQDAAMVPAGSTSLTICGPEAHMLTSGYQTLVSALNRLQARPSTRSCSPSPGPSAPEYQLLFSYPGGPPVSVLILSGCHPEIDNGNLQSNSASSILPVIQQLLKPK